MWPQCGTNTVFTALQPTLGEAILNKLQFDGLGGQDLWILNMSFPPKSIDFFFHQVVLHHWIKSPLSNKDLAQHLLELSGVIYMG